MSQTISDEQRRLNKSLHESNPNYGNRSGGGGAAGNLSSTLIRMNEINICNSVLDYGTGKGKLVDKLKAELPPQIKVIGYDPAVEKFEQRPSKADIVVSFDVLEHIEINTIDSVLEDIKSLTNNFCYLIIDLQPAVKSLADGRNAHIMLAPTDWWVSRVNKYFAYLTVFPIYHTNGCIQKMGIGATSHGKFYMAMCSFIHKLGVINMQVTGGKLKNKK